MTDDKFKVCVEIIRKCREMDKFTIKNVAKLLCISSYEAKGCTCILFNIGSIVKVGGKLRSGAIIPDFAVADNAITRLYQHMRERDGEYVPVVIEQEVKPKRIEFCGTVVEKAYLEPGFGRSFINNIDTMLREVRCGMSAMR